MRRDGQSRLRIVPCTLTRANEYVSVLHRHHQPTAWNHAGFAVAVADETGLVHGVGIAGRPVARLLDDGWTLEVNRVATDGHPNACSAVYGALARIARHMGYRRIYTYTRIDELGGSLRGAGWTLDDPALKARTWNMPSRPRIDRTEIVKRQRWIMSFAVGVLDLSWPHVPVPDQLELEVCNVNGGS